MEKQSKLTFILLLTLLLPFFVTAMSTEENAFYNDAVLIKNTNLCGVGLRDCEAIFKITSNENKSISGSLTTWLENQNGQVIDSNNALLNVETYYYEPFTTLINETVCTTEDVVNVSAGNGTTSTTTCQEEEKSYGDVRKTDTSLTLIKGESYVRVWSADKLPDTFVDWNLNITGVKYNYSGVETTLDFSTKMTDGGQGWAEWGATLGDWQYRINITISGDKVTEDLVDFPVYLDMSNFPATFFGNVSLNGNDTVITTDDNRILKREVSYLEANGGEVYFRANLTAGVNHSFFYYYGNGNGTETNDDDTWNSNYLTVWHYSVPTNQNIQSSAPGVHRLFGGNFFTPDDLVNATPGRGWRYNRTKGSHTSLGENLAGTYDTVQYWVDADQAYGTGTSVGYLFDGLVPTDFLALGSVTGGLANEIIVFASPWTNAFWWDSTDLAEFPIGSSSLSFSWNSSQSYYDFFLNGTQTGSPNIANTPVRWSNFNNGDYFGSNDAQTGQFDGVISEIRILNAPLSGSWLSSEEENINSPNTFYGVGVPESNSGVPVNTPPVVASVVLSSPNVTGFSPVTLEFNGQIDDADGNTTQYQWKLFLDGVFDSSGSDGFFVSGVDRNWRNVSVTNSGTYVLELTGYDGENVSTPVNSTGLAVTITPVPNVAPVVINSELQSPNPFGVGSALLLFVGQINDANGNTTRYEWNLFLNDTFSVSGTSGYFVSGVDRNFFNQSVTASGTYILEITGYDGVDVSTPLNSTGFVVSLVPPPVPPDPNEDVNHALNIIIILLALAVVLGVFTFVIPVESARTMILKFVVVIMALVAIIALIGLI